MSLSLREYSAGFILVPVVMALALTFSGGLFNTFDANVDDEGVDQIRENFEDASPDSAQRRSELEDVNTRSDFFYIKSVWNVIGGVAASAANVFNLMWLSVTTLNLPGELVALGSLVVIGVVFEIVSLARGFRT